MPDWKQPFKEIEVGKGRKMRDGDDIAVLSFGPLGNFVTTAAEKLAGEGIQIGHYDLRFVKPIDEELLHEVFSKYKKIITLEDGTTVGGMGSAILEFMAQHKYTAEVKMLGMPDKITEHGEPAELYAECGYDVKGIMKSVHEMIAEKVNV
jgi:1-deoxy-D-xylulose-5-phosphate synthase